MSGKKLGNGYPHLLSPGRIGSLEVRNRIFVTAMGVSLSEADGHVGERLIAYHEEQAKGGAGLIVTGVAGVAWPTGAVQPNQTAISDDCFLPGLTRLVDRVHRHGAKIAAQLHHGGLVAGYSADAFDEELWAPCYPPQFKGDFIDYFLPEEMAGFSGKMPSIRLLSAEDIDTVVAQFGAAAARARAAGFDAIELHGGHGYLISSFLSPKTNSRTDEYGGPLENRARLLLRVIAAIREAVGPDFPLWVKLDSIEVGKEGGITLDLAIETARMVEAAGVDAITVSAYHNAAMGKLHSASNIPHEPETNIPAAKAIKAAVDVPVIASGRVEPEAGDRQIGQGVYDFLAMGRKLLADPHLPRKLAGNAPEGVRPCIYCYTCVSTAYVRQPLRCAVNPETGFECERQAPVRTGKHFVVIGGGPGGMEAACRLSEAGNRVTLLERSDRLGGTLRFASLAYPANERLLDWLIRETEQSSVDIRLETTATPDLLGELAPDGVIVATGARRDMPALPGADQAHVFSGDDMRNLMLGEGSQELRRKTGLATRLATKIGAATGITANLDFVRSATKAWMPLGQRIVIVGGELVGVELAEFLHERGREVTVIEPAPRLGKGLLLVRRMRLLAELKEHGVALHGGVKDISIGKSDVSFTDVGGEARLVPADHVIVAMGAGGDNALAESLRKAGFAVETVGDCNGIGYIEGAIRGAAEAVDRVLAA
ncbi:FAD-dependent oxidoreductase [Altererythrobacter sp. H2]|uniref:oxidoreductase n=1 Tax=Altererythrobacter sp. H2 TaxID=3108391 RepID=UPI002B4BDB36|nr:FAD-dependent oxidoreductase [Altererythrobacter sp. H2]WRK95169.1 FAD-dependent oxidoreductase [Altererythrobacter sp. H2]